MDEVQHLDEEQRRDLAALEMAASDAPSEPGALSMPEPEVIDPAAEWAAVIGLAVAVASPLLPYLPAIYTPEVVQRLGQAVGPVAVKYGWDVGSICGDYAAEIGLAVVAVPLLIQTRNAHADYLAEKERQARAAEEAARAPQEVAA